jgi:hypothetical protein
MSNNAAFKYDLAISPRNRARGLPENLIALIEEGAGNAGCPMRRGLVCAYGVKYSQRRHRNHPAFPRAKGFNGFLRALVTSSLFATVVQRIEWCT